MKAPGRLPRTTRLQPGKGFGPRKARMPRRSAPLPSASPKGRAQKAALTTAYAQAADAQQCWCSACGQPGATDHSHHFSQGQHKPLATDQRNWLRLCRACHELFEHQKPRFAARFADCWARILAAMQAVDPAAFATWAALRPELLEPAPPRGYAYLHEL